MKKLQFDFLRELLEGIKETLHHIEKEIHTMAVSQAQFDTDLATQGADLTTLLGLVSQLIALVQAGGTGTVDLTNEDTAINSEDASIQAAIAAAQAVIPAGTPSAQLKK